MSKSVVITLDYLLESPGEFLKLLMPGSPPGDSGAIDFGCDWSLHFFF